MTKAIFYRISINAIVFIIFFEVLLRLSGLYFFSNQDKYNQILKDDTSKIRILTLGDSTTDESFAVESGVISWPTQLQNILNNKDQKVRIYNKAVSGINSYFVVEKIEDYIEIYKPHIVIAMMGINDVQNLGAYKSNWIQQLKILKFIKNYKKYLFSNRQDHLLESFISNNQNILNEVHLRISKENLNLKNFEDLIQKHFSTDMEIFYFKVAIIEKLLFSNDSVSKYKETLSDLIESANQSRIISRQLVFSTLYFYNLFNDAEKCLNFAQKMSDETKYIFSEEEITRALSCYDRLPIESRTKYHTFFKNQISSINLNTSINSTADNYLYLYNMLVKENIQLVIVGYPNRSTNFLKKYFRKAGAKDIKIVSNEDNFIQSLNSNEYKKYFIDKFAGNFGHATTLGNRLIAERVAENLQNCCKK